MLMCYIYVFLLHRESHDMILGDEPLISEVVLSQRSPLLHDKEATNRIRRFNEPHATIF
jgi:hypothetical protein